MTSFSRDDYAEERFNGIEITDSQIRFKSFDTCTFSKCRFNNSHFIECHFSACHFVHCDLSLTAVKQCSFSGVTFENCKLVGIDWTEANWTTHSLMKALAFDGCTLNYGTFIGLALRKLAVTRCTAHDVDFSDADLTQADFQHTDLRDSRFQNTNLTEANFVGARNYTINASTNKLKKTRFALPEAISLLHSLDIVLVDEDASD